MVIGDSQRMHAIEKAKVFSMAIISTFTILNACAFLSDSFVSIFRPIYLDISPSQEPEFFSEGDRFGFPRLPDRV